MNREQVILRHFQKNKYISSKLAFELYSITRLSAAIYNLRQQGIKIGSVWRNGVNRYGNPTRWMDYYLEKRGKLWKKQ